MSAFCNQTEMFRFETKNFVIRAAIFPDVDVDTSFDETGETAENIESGLWEAFGTIVTVETKEGVELGSDILCGSIYENPHEFFTAHRDSNPMSRNCSAMRTVNGQNSCICHYFPEMIREAIRNARNTCAKIELRQRVI